MPQRALPICIECNEVITDWNGRSNRPLFCFLPKMCRYQHRLRPLPLCARPGCRRPYERRSRVDGRAMSSQRYCWDHQTSPENPSPCLWCGKPTPSRGVSMDRNHAKRQRYADYCSLEHRQMMWNYPRQPTPICRMCKEPVEMNWQHGDPLAAGSWMILQDPFVAHIECWLRIHKDEAIIISHMLHRDVRIRAYTIKIEIPKWFSEEHMSDKMRKRILKVIGLTEEDLTSTPAIRATVRRDFKEWQKEERDKETQPRRTSSSGRR